MDRASVAAVEQAQADPIAEVITAADLADEMAKPAAQVALPLAVAPVTTGTEDDGALARRVSAETIIREESDPADEIVGVETIALVILSVWFFRLKGMWALLCSGAITRSGRSLIALNSWMGAEFLRS